MSGTAPTGRSAAAILDLANTHATPKEQGAIYRFSKRDLLAFAAALAAAPAPSGEDTKRLDALAASSGFVKGQDAGKAAYRKVIMTVRYSISVNRVAEVYEKYSHDGDLSSYVQTATQEAFKAVTARYTAPDLIAQRAKVSSDIAVALRSKLDLYGAQVINIDTRNFAFSDGYMKAISAKVTQEQLRLGAENKLRTVESEQKQKVAIAEAEASALRAKPTVRHTPT